jgi:hypothetical protein
MIFEPLTIISAAKSDTQSLSTGDGDMISAGLSVQGDMMLPPEPR